MNHGRWLKLIDGAHEFDRIASDTKISHRKAARAELAWSRVWRRDFLTYRTRSSWKLRPHGCEASTEVKNRADAILAAHKPLPQWAVERVLLSSDLVPHLLAPLQVQLKDGAAAAVCSRLADSWKATSEGRCRLTRVAFDFPQDLLGHRTWPSPR